MWKGENIYIHTYIFRKHMEIMNNRRGKHACFLPWSSQGQWPGHYLSDHKASIFHVPPWLLNSPIIHIRHIPTLSLLITIRGQSPFNQGTPFILYYIIYHSVSFLLTFFLLSFIPFQYPWALFSVLCQCLIQRTNLLLPTTT